MKSKLDRLLWEVSSGARRMKDDEVGSLGIEVELEGTLGDCKPQTFVIWKATHDGSLRDGVEYILRHPVPRADLAKVGVSFKEALIDYIPQTSIRTSMHIHINVAPLTFRKIYHTILLYYMLEEVLIRAQPDERRGNLFCLRMSDSRILSRDLRESLTDGYFHFFKQDFHKYGALNLAAVTKYGSLEFRFMQAVTTPAEIIKWATALNELVLNAHLIEKPEEFLNLYETLTAQEFVLRFIPSGSWLFNNISRLELNELIHTNYDAVVELVRALNNHDRFSLPPQLWNDDEDPEVYQSILKDLRRVNPPETEIEWDESPPLIYDDVPEPEDDDTPGDMNW